MEKTVRSLLLVLFAFIICVNGYKLFEIYTQHKKEAQIKADMRKYRFALSEIQYGAGDLDLPNIMDGNNNSKQALDGVRQSTNQSIIDLQNEVNKDVIGWLTIPNTKIDYPFVISKDNDYYLRRDIYGNQASAGTLFMDFRCGRDFLSFNTIIYGHNMKNGGMFSDLKKYADMSFFDRNASGTIFLGKDTYKLEIFAYIIVRADDAIIYNPLAERSVFYEYVKQNASNFREPKATGNVVALSTCTYDYDDARMVVLANITLLNTMAEGAGWTA